MMIIEVSHNLFVGDMEGCTIKDATHIHACKHPCYANVSGKNIDKSSIDYIYRQVGDDLYLNIIDPDEPIFYRETFDIALWFIEKNIEKIKVVIHCNSGVSRSPQIAMLYLFNDLTYREAQNKMLDIYNDYNPSIGIDLWLGLNWESFCKAKTY